MALLLAGIAAVLLYRFPPAVYGFYPVCPVQQFLHLECPGCGATRAFAALLQGRVGEALRLNALFVAVVLPIGSSWGFLVYLRAIRGDEFRWPQLPKAALYAGVAGMAMFTVARNL